MAEDVRINPQSGQLDKIGQTSSDITANDLRYLKLDQTSQQSVINGAPNFSVGATISTLVITSLTDGSATLSGGNLTLTDIAGTDLNFTNGTIGTLTFTSVYGTYGEFTSATIGTLSTTNISGSNFDFTTGTIGTLNITTLSDGTATLSGGNLSLTNINVSNVALISGVTTLNSAGGAGGPTISDYGSGANTITEVGTPTSQNSVTKVWDYCYDFDGDSDYLQSAGVSSSISGTSGAISFWIYCDADEGASVYPFIIGDNTGGNATQLDCNILFYSDVNDMRFRCYVDGTVYWRWRTYNDFDFSSYIGQWVHVLITHNGTTPTFYFNGTDLSTSGGLWETTTDKTKWFADMVGATNPANDFIIGATVPESPTAFFNGKISDFRISNSAWTSSNATTLYNSGSGTTDAIGDEVFWMHSEPSGGGAITVSAIATTGTISVNHLDGTTIAQLYLEDDLEVAGTIFLNDSEYLMLGTGEDVSLSFNGSNLVINSENVTASNSILFTNFDSYVFDNTVSTIALTSTIATISGNVSIATLTLGTLNLTVGTISGNLTLTTLTLGTLNLTTSTVSGNSSLSTITGSTLYLNANLFTPNLPTSDPGVAGQIYSTGGTLMISSG